MYVPPSKSTSNGNTGKAFSGVQRAGWISNCSLGKVYLRSINFIYLFNMQFFCHFWQTSWIAAISNKVLA